jgi:membrane-associated phospholipid phosphatase
MGQPNDRQKDVEVLNPLMNSNLTKNIFKFYEKIHTYDVQLSKSIYDFNNHYKVIYYASKALEFMSDTIALPIFYLLYGLAKSPLPVIFVVFTLFFIVFAEFGVKGVFQRKRPVWTLKLGFAFPSSHAFASGVAFGTVLLFRVEYAAFVIPFALVIPLTRILLGYHYIADVIIGFTLGMLIPLLWLASIGLFGFHPY